MTFWAAAIISPLDNSALSRRRATGFECCNWIELLSFSPVNGERYFKFNLFVKLGFHLFFQTSRRWLNIVISYGLARQPWFQVTRRRLTDSQNSKRKYWSILICLSHPWIGLHADSFNVVGLVSSLQWKIWAIAIPDCWMLYVELRQMVASGNVSACCTTQKNTIKLVKLATQQLDTFLLETQVSKGIGNMKERSERSETWQNYGKVKISSSKLWWVRPECGRSMLQVIDTDAIVRGAHLLPIYEQSKCPATVQIQIIFR